MSDGGMMQVAEGAVALAKKAGAQEVAAGVARVRQVDVQWRDGKVEKLSEAVTRGLALELYVDGRYSAVSTSDLRPEAVERFVADSVALEPLTVPFREKLPPIPLCTPTADAPRKKNSIIPESSPYTMPQ